MTVASKQNSWVEENQRYVVTRLAALKMKLGADGDEHGTKEAIEEIRVAMEIPPAVEMLTDSFGLSAFEQDLLLLCAGVELDAEIARRCGETQGFPQRPYATFGLALSILSEPHWSALAPVSTLRRWRLVEVDESAGLANGRLRIDERILHYITGMNYLDTRVQPLLRLRPAVSAMAATHKQVSRELLDILTNPTHSPPVVQFTGDDPQGQGDVAGLVASRLGLPLYVLAGEDLPISPAEIEAVARIWQREAILLNAALLVEGHEGDVQKKVTGFINRLTGLVFLTGQEPISLTRPIQRIQVEKPESQDQRSLWEEVLGPEAGRLNGTLDAIATQFCLSAQTILSTGQEVRKVLAERDDPDQYLWQACRKASGSKLDELAQRISQKAEWDDLILPTSQKDTLRMIAAQVRHRLGVYHEWGFANKGSRGLGITALFAGESGTGKTMAAEVLANELQLDVFRIDLSSVVSKYIGETEKNLRRVFNAAEESGSILLFDEADALFGKRSEVKDSHDRYANIEVSYLLQRMEAYRGLAILTTNMKGALDTAFQRRLRFVVSFPFPDAMEREAIWRGIFPDETPLNALDYGKLARLQVAGGNIRNIALNSAFLAAESQEQVGMEHLLQAAHSEAAKRERPFSDAEIRGWQ